MDRSMEPTLLPGDRLCVDTPRAPGALVERGAIVLLRDPEESGRWLLKRVSGLPGDLVARGPDGYSLGTSRESVERPGVVSRALHPHEVFVTGDNSAVSRDSRRFGPVDRAVIAGRVWFRYAPVSRRGPVP